jgi:membrane protein DedA with SNARE-associated domain
MLLDVFRLLVKTYGYLGLFLINLIGSSTIFLPLPSAVFVFAAGALLNPFLVALFSALGAVLGEFTGCAVGICGRKVIQRKWKKWIKKTEKLFKKYGVFWVIMLFAATPLPDDIIGIIVGVSDYPLKKFFIASFIGKLILNLVLAYGGFYGIRWTLHYFGSGV